MAAWVLKYFLSETIHAQENGSTGTHFAKFLISNFPKGLTYSALMVPQTRQNYWVVEFKFLERQLLSASAYLML